MAFRSPFVTRLVSYRRRLGLKRFAINGWSRPILISVITEQSCLFRIGLFCVTVSPRALNWARREVIPVIPIANQYGMVVYRRGFCNLSIKDMTAVIRVFPLCQSAGQGVVPAPPESW